MEWNVYQDKIKRNLKSLSRIEKVNFALITCKDLIPDYINFETNRNWGDSKILMRGIDILKEFIKTNTFDLGLVLDTIAELDKVIPDTDNFGDLDGSLALNASAAMHESLAYLIYEQDDGLLAIASYADNTAEAKLWDKNPSLTESEISKHKTLADEMAKVLSRTKKS